MAPSAFGSSAGTKNGYVGIQDNRERMLVEMGATTSGDGLVRTLSPQGITTWSSDFAQSNAGSTRSLRGDWTMMAMLMAMISSCFRKILAKDSER